MVGISYKFQNVSILVDLYIDRYLEALEQAVRRAAYAFLRSAAPRIRVRTGFAHGSLRALAAAINRDLPSGAPGTTPRGKEYYYYAGGRVLKTPFSSVKFATPMQMIFLKNSNDGTVVFQYTIDISYIRKATDLTTFDDARKRFEFELVRTLPDLLPDLNDFVTTIKG